MYRPQWCFLVRFQNRMNQDSRISVECVCGNRFKAKPELSGKTVNCPVCQSPLAIPVAKVPAPGIGFEKLERVPSGKSKNSSLLGRISLSKNQFGLIAGVALSLLALVCLLFFLAINAGKRDEKGDLIASPEEIKDPGPKLDLFALPVWRERFYSNRKRVEKREFDSVENFISREGVILLNDIDDPVAFAKQEAEKDELAGWEDVMYSMAGTHARVDRLELAIEVAEKIPNRIQRGAAFYLMANMQVNRGDIDDALLLVDRSPEGRRDFILERIIGKELENKHFESARKKLTLVEDKAMREELTLDVEQVSQRPQPSDVEFVEKEVAWIVRRRLDRLEGMKDAIEFLGGTDDAVPTETQMMALTTCIAEIEFFHHRQDSKESLRQLEKAFVIVGSLEDENSKTTETMSLAIVAHKYDQDEFARRLLLKMLNRPETDQAFFSLSLMGLDLMDTVVALLGDDELAPLVERWSLKSSSAELAWLADSLAEQHEFQRLDWLYQLLDDEFQRLWVCNIAIEEILQME